MSGPIEMTLAAAAIRTAVEQEIAAWLRKPEGTERMTVAQAIDACPQDYLNAAADYISSGAYRKPAQGDAG